MWRLSRLTTLDSGTQIRSMPSAEGDDGGADHGSHLSADSEEWAQNQTT